MNHRDKIHAIPAPVLMNALVKAWVEYRLQANALVPASECWPEFEALAGWLDDETRAVLHGNFERPELD